MLVHQRVNKQQPEDFEVFARCQRDGDPHLLGTLKGCGDGGEVRPPFGWDQVHKDIKTYLHTYIYSCLDTWIHR